MNRPRIIAFLTATGLLATGLLGQGRDRVQGHSSGDRGGGQMSSESRGASGGFGSDRLGTGGDNRGGGSGFSPADERRNLSTNSSLSRAAATHGVLTSGTNPRVYGWDYHWQPCPLLPDSYYWGRRDILAEIQFMSRGGFVPCTRVADDALEVSDYADFPQGWKGYAFVVPPKGTLHVSLNHVNRGWFRMVMMNKWGDLEAGMLKNLIYTGNPEVTYTNPTNEIKAVYVIADDPGWMSSKAYPYQLTVDRSWDPTTVDLKNVKVAVGVWGRGVDISAQFQRPTYRGFGSWDRLGGGWW